MIKKCCGKLPNGESWGHSGLCETMQTNKEIRKEFIKLCMEDQKSGIHYNSTQSDGFKEDMQDIADWWLAKLQEQKQQMIEKGDGLKKEEIKRTPEEKLLNAVFSQEKVFTKEAVMGYNQAITNYQNLIKEI